MTDAIHTPSQLTAYVREALRVRALPEKAPEMAAYMKVAPEVFCGVSGPGRDEIARELKARVKVRSALHYRQLVGALWAEPHRESRYLALSLARMLREHIGPHALPLYERMIREGAWWDLVDPNAAWLLGGVWRTHRSVVSPVADRFLTDDDLWIRRAAVTGQVRHREETDAARLFAYCRTCAPETDFFMRKAIGTALREYSRVEPEAVRSFLLKNRGRLSGLSFREGARHLRKTGVM